MVAMTPLQRRHVSTKMSGGTAPPTNTPMLLINQLMLMLAACTTVMAMPMTNDHTTTPILDTQIRRGPSACNNESSLNMSILVVWRQYMTSQYIHGAPHPQLLCVLFKGDLEGGSLYHLVACKSCKFFWILFYKMRTLGLMYLL